MWLLLMLFCFCTEFLHLFDKDLEESVEVDQPLEAHLHSNIPKEYRYFSALLFDRWQVTVDKKPVLHHKFHC